MFAVPVHRRLRSARSQQPRSRTVALLAGLCMVVGMLTACDPTPVLISGQVSFAATSTPARGVTVELYDDVTESLVATTDTDQDGRYRFRDSTIDAGTYRLRINGRWWQDADGWADATPVVADPDTPAAADASTVAAATLTGQIVDHTGTPLTGIVVLATPAEPSAPANHAATNADGTFALPLSQAGAYTVQMIDLTGTHPPISLGGTTPTPVTASGPTPIGTTDITTGLPHQTQAPAWAELAAGGQHSCALDVQGAITCWGDDARDQVSDAPTTTGWTTLSAGSTYNCALDAQGAITCWGSNFNGEVSNTPTTTGWTDISAGGQHTCALDAQGAIACWGLDEDGAIGDAPTTAGWTDIAAGYMHTCALDALGAVTCWGNDDYQQLSSVPVGSFTGIAAGDVHTCALDAQGAITCWGWDGDGGGDPTDSPTTFGWTHLAVGGWHTCALDAQGAVACWGTDFEGDVTDTPSTTGWGDLAAGGWHNCALDAQGEITCWGYDHLGQVSGAPN